MRKEKVEQFSIKASRKKEGQVEQEGVYAKKT